jgi:hypothetical protein
MPGTRILMPVWGSSGESRLITALRGSGKMRAFKDMRASADTSSSLAA